MKADVTVYLFLLRALHIRVNIRSCVNKKDVLSDIPPYEDSKGDAVSEAGVWCNKYESLTYKYLSS